MTLLDASFLIDLQQEDSGAEALWSSLLASGQPLRIPAAVWLEYLAGFDDASRRQAVGPLEGSCAFEAFERETAELGAGLQHQLAKSGQPMAWSDIQVAATALFLREPLATNDEAFTRVPGLQVLTW